VLTNLPAHVSSFIGRHLCPTARMVAPITIRPLLVRGNAPGAVTRPRAAAEARRHCRAHERVVVDVDDAGFGGDGLGDLVSVARSGQTRADVEKLPDAALTGKVADGAGQERPVGPRAGDHLRPVRSNFLGRFPVGRIMIFPADPDRVDTSRMRYRRVEPGRAAAG
jgi:hypothetical protein